MIISGIIGGLGNQMFQYAAGRRLARERGVELKLDLAGFEKYPLRKYELHHFNIQAPTASAEEVAALTGRNWGMPRRAFEKARRMLLRRRHSRICEAYFHFDPSILNLPDGVYLEGYWQSEKYFADVADIIRREFTVKTPLAGRNRELADLMASTDSVSLHIRRGDYVTDPKAVREYEACGLDYYLRCLDRLTQAVRAPHCFIFSDDIPWVRENLKVPCPTTLVDHGGPDTAHEDLRLMSLCKHHVIANSSFSWWGAWLGSAKDGMVLGPKQWFRPEMHRNTDDLFPSHWIRL
jgi:hypothetical protein